MDKDPLIKLFIQLISKLLLDDLQLNNGLSLSVFTALAKKII
ncbi:hypothetical protein (plasmid) [Metabacillus dongyingensis]|nr:hypothetical protein [Metabacillus dongyingensis]